MAFNATTVTVGTSEVLIDVNDLPPGDYYLIADDLNTATVWVNIGAKTVSTVAAADEHAPLRPTESVWLPESMFPFRMISTVAGQTVTVSKL